MASKSKAAKRMLAAVSLVAMGLWGAAAAQAAIVTVGTRGAIPGPTTTIDWGSLGGDATPVGSSVGVGSAIVSGASEYTVWQQAPTGSWSGNFSDGESVLSMYDLASGAGEVPGVFDIEFGSPISGFGTQVQDFFFGSFNVTVDLYDTSASLLGSFNFAGNSTPAGDGSALFVGFVSDTLNIQRVVISGMGAGSGINQLTLSTRDAPPPPVPAPATLALALLGIAAASAARRSRA